MLRFVHSWFTANVKLSDRQLLFRMRCYCLAFINAPNRKYRSRVVVLIIWRWWQAAAPKCPLPLRNCAPSLSQLKLQVMARVQIHKVLNVKKNEIFSINHSPTLINPSIAWPLHQKSRTYRLIPRARPKPRLSSSSNMIQHFAPSAKICPMG